MIARYRAWDTRDQRMLIVREIYFNNDGPTAVRIIGNVSTTRYKKTDFLRVGRFKLMQWTGLLDKNGEEIFAGDILEFTDKWEWYRSQYSADFMFATPGSKEAEDMQAKYDAEPIHRFEVKYDLYGGYQLIKSDVEQYLAVVGNIYTTPELLKTEE